MTTTTDPDRYLDPEYRARARRSATFLGEPAATELRAALDALDKQATEIEALAGEEPPDVQHFRYAIDAMIGGFDEWLENPDPAEAYHKLLDLLDELRELVSP